MNLSIPSVQPIPEGQTIYSPKKLNLLAEFDREEYEKATKTQAPPFNQDLKPKLWADHTALGKTGTLTYTKLVAPVNKEPYFEDFTIGALEASQVNIPGKYRYPKWEPDPTNAIIVSVYDPSKFTPFSTYTLSTEDQAWAMLKELGASSVEVVTAVGSANRYDYRAETRRVHALHWPDNRPPLVVGLLLRYKYANGVGAPGEWADPGKSYEWNAAPVDDGSNRKDFVPVPCRQLSSGEVFDRNMFGLQIHYTPGNAPATEMDLLRTMSADLREILRRLGG